MAWEVWKLMSSSSTTPATLQEGLSVIEKVGLPHLFLPSLLYNMEQRRVSDVHPDGLIGWGLDSGDPGGQLLLTGPPGSPARESPSRSRKLLPSRSGMDSSRWFRSSAETVASMAWHVDTNVCTSCMH